MAIAVLKYCCVVILVLICILDNILADAAENHTSHRMVYYLYTVPRTWNEAKILCSVHDATLVILKDEKTITRLQFLDATTEWNGNFTAMLNENPFWIGLYEDNSTYYWEGCNRLTSWPFWNDSTPDMQPTDTCVSIDKDYHGISTQCNTKQRFICQRNEGECWFDPVPFHTTNEGTTSAPTRVASEAECAKQCRNAFSNGTECWAFSYDYINLDCYLHFTADIFSYIKDNRILISDNSRIFYSKMCFEGIKREDNRTIQEASPNPVMSTCEGVTPSTETGDGDVCYCGCEAPPAIFDAELQASTIDDKLEAIKKELFVDTKNISSTLRKLVSATDDRPSAVSIGYVGVAFMILVFGGIVLLDFNLLVSAFHEFHKTLKERNNLEK